jgi:hypothetical protein
VSLVFPDLELFAQAWDSLSFELPRKSLSGTDRKVCINSSVDACIISSICERHLSKSKAVINLFYVVRQLFFVVVFFLLRSPAMDSGEVLLQLKFSDNFGLSYFRVVSPGNQTQPFFC